MSAGAILSAAAPSVRIVGYHTEPGAVAALPGLALQLGPFTQETTPAGLVRVRDAAGGACGVFVNKQLADATVAALSR